MRWKTKPIPKQGMRRIVSRFLWWPRYFDGEARWLERARIHQMYIEEYFQGDDSSHWQDTAWAD